jgi:hypothetical protein
MPGNTNTSNYQKGTGYERYNSYEMSQPKWSYELNKIEQYWYSEAALTYGAGWTEDDGMSMQTAGSNVTLSFYSKLFHSF